MLIWFFAIVGYVSLASGQRINLSLRNDLVRQLNLGEFIDEGNILFQFTAVNKEFYDNLNANQKFDWNSYQKCGKIDKRRRVAQIYFLPNRSFEGNVAVVF